MSRHARPKHQHKPARSGRHRSHPATGTAQRRWAVLLAALATLTAITVTIVVPQRAQTPTGAPAPAPVPPSGPESAAADGAAQDGTVQDGAAESPEPTVPGRSLAPLRVPETGPGEFAVAAGQTPIRGSANEVVDYTVEVERGLPLRPGEVAEQVDAVLGDSRSWIAAGRVGLRRTTDAPDVRVLLATPGTTDELCAPLRTEGRLSCRNGDLVVLNAWRWVHGADTYPENLTGYRRYLVNHEVGHALGNPHAACSGPGAPAPVMAQQTKGIGQCRPNPWPYP